MFSKLFVLVSLFAAVYSKPGFLPTYPAATSHVSRIDIHEKPIATAYATPYHSGYGLGGYGLGGYGLGGYGLGGYGYGASGYGGYGYGHGYGNGYGHEYGYPLAQSYSNRIDIHDDGHVGYGHLGHGYDGLVY